MNNNKELQQNPEWKALFERLHRTQTLQKQLRKKLIDMLGIEASASFSIKQIKCGTREVPYVVAQWTDKAGKRTSTSLGRYVADEFEEALLAQVNESSNTD